MGKKLTVYMIDGTAYEPRLSEIGNWLGKAIYCPRASVNKIIHRNEFNNSGVYCLKGDPTDDAFDDRIYIGEAENIMTIQEFNDRIDKSMEDSKNGRLIKASDLKAEMKKWR